MEISVDLENLELDDEEKSQVSDIINSEDEEELSEDLSPFMRAAAEEYIRMFLGQKKFTRGRDIIEYRLFLLIKHVFKERIPDEQTVCDLFQVKDTKARSLIRSVMSKYQYDLDKRIEDSITRAIENAEKDENDESQYILDIDKSLADEINGLLTKIDRSSSQVKKKRNTTSSYLLKESSKEKLEERLDIETEDEE